MVIMTMTPDVNVVVLDFKSTKEREMVTENEDGSFTIFINARLSYKSQLESYNHAMKHIENNDFIRDDVQNIEAVAHNIEKPIIKEEHSEFRKRILSEISKSRRRIQKELKKIEERNAWLAENDPDYWFRMEGYNLEMQRIGNI